MQPIETPVNTQFTVYLKDGVRKLLEGVEPGDVLLWLEENGKVTVSVRKKGAE